MVELARRKAAVAARGVRVLDFGTGDPVEPTDDRIRRALAEAVPVVSQYPTVEGDRSLRAAFARWCEGRFGVRLDPDSEVLPSQGSKEAIFHLPLVLLDPSTPRRVVVFPEPGYPVMEIGALYSEAETHAVRLDAANGYVMTPDAVPASVLDRTAIVWLNYPHNPTGQDLPDDVWRAWEEARRRHGFVLCSDECYTELWFGERPRSALEFSREGCLAFHSLSKRSGMTAYRSGIVAGDARLVARYRAARAGMGLAMPEWTQRASTVAWGDEEHVVTRRAAFGRKREVMIEGLSRLGLGIFPSTSTFYLWIGVPEGEDDASYAARLLEAGILVSPGSFFGAGQERFVRVALVPSAAQCEEAVARWSRL